MLRSVTLPTGISGHLFLSAMPGRYESFSVATKAITSQAIGCIFCLVPAEEIEKLSPQYGRAMAAEILPCAVVSSPVPDFGLPPDGKTYIRIVQEAAGRLRSGNNILVHCGAGIGRTGVFAVSVLMALGIALPEATELVARAGSNAEGPGQKKFVSWVAEELKGNCD